MMSRRRQRKLRAWFIYSSAVLLTILILAPVIWMALMSVSSTNDLTTVGFGPARTCFEKQRSSGERRR